VKYELAIRTVKEHRAYYFNTLTKPKDHLEIIREIRSFFGGLTKPKNQKSKKFLITSKNFLQNKKSFDFFKNYEFHEFMKNQEIIRETRNKQ
jgi:hypothetical protein